MLTVKQNAQVRSGHFASTRSACSVKVDPEFADARTRKCAFQLIRRTEMCPVRDMSLRLMFQGVRQRRARHKLLRIHVSRHRVEAAKRNPIMNPKDETMPRNIRPSLSICRYLRQKINDKFGQPTSAGVILWITALGL